jgi:hypothetical protein
MRALRVVRLLTLLAASLTGLAACREAEPVIAADREASGPAPRPERPQREHYLGMAVPEHEAVPFPNVRGECEPGQTLSCGSLPLAGGGLHHLRMVCRLDGAGVPRFDKSACATPLVVAWDDAPVVFEEAAGAFTVGPFPRTEWPSARTPWLALDADGSGCVEGESELFRFDRLATLDDDHDGRIDERDAAYRSLGLWADRDRDKRCTPGEMTSLAAAGVVALELAYVTASDPPFGSHEGETASVWFRAPGGGGLRRGRLVDVYLAPLP